ncbi:MAG: hypothetical protein RIK87_13570 [Fuerstiella sp.]
MMMTVLCLPALTATGQSVPLWVRTTTTEAEAGAAIGTETSTGTATDTAPIGVATMSPALTDPDELFTRVSSEPPSPMTEPWSEPVSVLTLGPEVTPPDFLASSVTPPAVPPETPAEFPITLPPSKKSGCADEAFDLNSDDEEENKRLSFQQLMREPYAVYRTYESSLAWLPAGGEDFGWLDWETEPYLRRGEDGGLVSMFNIHWLRGPNSVPLPARLYDFAVGYQWRDSFSSRFSYDLYTSVGIYSDFEGSARDGVRFPGHAVGMYHLNRSTDLVFGVDYLARDNVGLLPVVGVSLRDVGVRGLRLDLVFPRPRIDYLLNDSHRVYLSGRTTGGNWDIDFPNGADHVMSYRDYRLTLGFEKTDDDGDLSAWEFGYVFGRSLELRGTQGDTRFDDAFMIRWVTRR